MSLLAERRKKQIIAPDPQNVKWTSDESTFGQRMLKRMGWEKGKGLGAKEQGICDPIVVKSNSTKTGLGKEAGYDSVWMEHQADFESLLAGLSNNSETDGKPSAAVSFEAKTSLEKVSKGSRSRIHYHRLARSKDLSSYSKDDLACIVSTTGKTLRKNQESAELKPEVATVSDAAAFPAPESNSIISSESTTDYFKRKRQKMEELTAKATTELEDSSQENRKRKKKKKSLKEETC